MTITITPTTTLVDVNAARARLWEGHAAGGLVIQCFVTHITVNRNPDTDPDLSDVELALAKGELSDPTSDTDDPIWQEMEQLLVQVQAQREEEGTGAVVAPDHWLAMSTADLLTMQDRAEAMFELVDGELERRGEPPDAETDRRLAEILARHGKSVETVRQRKTRRQQKGGM